MFTRKYELKHDQFGEHGGIFMFTRSNTYAVHLSAIATAVITAIAVVLNFTGNMSQQIVIPGNHLFIFCAVSFGLFITFFNRKKTESLLILSSLGIVITRSGVFRDYNKFVDIAEIDDIVILEVVTMSFQPRTEDLRIIYRDAQVKLFNKFSHKR